MQAGNRAVQGLRAGLLLAGLLALLPGGVAQATTYNFTSGYATLSATFNGNPILSTITPPTIPLTGTQVTFNNNFPSPSSLASFDFDAAGPNAIALTGLLTGTSITLTNVQIAPGGGYTNFSVTGGPSTFNYLVGPVAVSGTAQLSGLINAGPSPFSFSNPALSGQIQLGTGTLSLNGITLGQITLPPALPFFPGGTVTVKADIVFTGLVPEPGTALLLGCGIAGIGVAGRRNRRA